MGAITKIIKPVIIQSDKDTHFSGALATNAKEDENLTLIGANSGLITAIHIVSDQNLAWEIAFFGTDGFDDSNFDLQWYLGRVKFAASDGTRIAGAGPYIYTTTNISQPFQPIRYADLDESGELHISLINRDSTSKNAGATGEAVVTVVIDSDGDKDGFLNS